MAAGYPRLPLSRRHFVQGGVMVSLGLVARCGRLPWQAEPPMKVPRNGWVQDRPIEQ